MASATSAQPRPSPGSIFNSSTPLGLTRMINKQTEMSEMEYMKPVAKPAKRVRRPQWKRKQEKFLALWDKRYKKRVAASTPASTDLLLRLPEELRLPILQEEYESRAPKLPHLVNLQGPPVKGLEFLTTAQHIFRDFAPSFYGKARFYSTTSMDCNYFDPKYTEFDNPAHLATGFTLISDIFHHLWQTYGVDVARRVAPYVPRMIKELVVEVRMTGNKRNTDLVGGLKRYFQTYRRREKCSELTTLYVIFSGGCNRLPGEIAWLEDNRKGDRLTNGLFDLEKIFLDLPDDPLLPPAIELLRDFVPKDCTIVARRDKSWPCARRE